MKTVNFIEAVNSGKRFKTACNNNRFIYKINSVGNLVHLSVDGCTWLDANSSKSRDFINSQFELEEKTITITEREFDKACEKYYFNNSDFNSETFAAVLKKELGF